MDGTGRLFEPLLAALPPTVSPRVVAYPPDRPLGYDDLLPLVEAAAAGPDDFVVVGESFSGPLALMLAARRPPGLRGVVLCASFVRSPFPGPWRAVVGSWMFRLRPLGLVAWVLLGRYRRGRLIQVLGEAARAASPGALAARARAIAGVDVTAELRSCPVPILYLRASEDRVVRPRCWARVRAVRPDAAVADLPGPHLVLQAAPAAAARVLAAFCERVTAERAGAGGASLVTGAPEPRAPVNQTVRPPALPAPTVCGSLPGGLAPGVRGRSVP
jgi:pimeloyl-ACP methyl ester carboxylesterase